MRKGCLVAFDVAARRCYRGIVGVVREIYIAPEGSAPMQKVAEAEAIASGGLKGDRYCERVGYYTGWDECQVTLIESESLDEISRTTGIHVLNGEHRRNIGRPPGRSNRTRLPGWRSRVRLRSPPSPLRLHPVHHGGGNDAGAHGKGRYLRHGCEGGHDPDGRHHSAPVKTEDMQKETQSGLGKD